MYLDRLMVINLEPHLELEIERQLGLLDEMIWVLQLAPLMALDCCMEKSLGGLMAQNKQCTCCTWSKGVLS